MRSWASKAVKRASRSASRVLTLLVGGGAGSDADAEASPCFVDGGALAWSSCGVEARGWVGVGACGGGGVVGSAGVLRWKGLLGGGGPCIWALRDGGEPSSEDICRDWRGERRGVSPETCLRRGSLGEILDWVDRWRDGLAGACVEAMGCSDVLVVLARPSGVGPGEGGR